MDVSKVCGFATEGAEIHGRMTMPKEINDATNGYNQRRQKYSSTQQVAQNIFNPLIGPAPFWKHLDPSGKPVIEHLNG